MVLTFKVKKEHGQEAINWIKKRGWLNTTYQLGRTMQYLIIPLTSSADQKAIPIKGIFEIKNMQKQELPSGRLAHKLATTLKSDQLSKLNSSFDIVGDIAILDIPKELENLEKSIAWTVLRTTAGVKSVAKRATTTEGEFRIRKIKTIVGEKRTETIHTESGVKLKLDLNKAYFTPRWASERIRIAKQVKPKEKVLVLFAGVGPFSLVINKLQPKVEKVVSVELNEDAVKYMKENIRLNCNIYKNNKLPAIEVMQKKNIAICGDAKKVMKTLKEKFDRIVMPLPHSAIDFLGDAIKVAKKGAIIHLYGFDEKDAPKEMRSKIKKYPVKVLKEVVCGAYSPKIDRYCFDLVVNKAN